MSQKITAPVKSGRLNVKQFTDAGDALGWVTKIYESNTAFLKESFQAYARGEMQDKPVRACYPYVQVVLKDSPKLLDSRVAYGFLSAPGTYRTTLTRPDIFSYYYREQFEQILTNHPGCKLEVGVSEKPIPLHFALGETFHIEMSLTSEQIEAMTQYFDLPNLEDMDDRIANGTYETGPDKPRPLSLFTAQRVDVSLQRLKHYTGTTADHFQNYVLYTNYQFYVDEFARYAQELMKKADDREVAEKRKQYSAFVEPGNVVTTNANLGGTGQPEGERMSRLPQMPAYHLKREDGSGITLINIGVGPSNAKTITDHVAVLRPHAWVMLGHCAGLRNAQALGDYVLAHGYIREDNVLDLDLPVWVPVPALAEVQIALEQSVSEVTGLADYERKKLMRTGTVATISDRNWELRDYRYPVRRFSQSRAIALDMESATIAANGFRFRVPYGTLLCVSDKPLHGQLKLPGMADRFYRERVDQHLQIGLLTMEKLRSMGLARLHSRKLRSFDEVAFQ